MRSAAYSGPRDYTGNEPAVPAQAVPRPGSDSYFQVSKATPPPGATPIVDDETSTVIGYRQVVQGNTWIRDLDGNVVSIQEPGLETPLFDPLDAIFIVGALGRVAVRGAVRAGAEIAGDVAGKAAARVVTPAALATLRAVFRALVQRELQFTATTAARMAQPGRYVPVNILKLAVRYGARDADPQGVAGAFRYTIPMLKAAKRAGDPARRYTLRVIVREKDWTVLHFHYE